MLFLFFSLISGIFNVIARQFIQISAVEQINATYNNLMIFIEQAEYIIERQTNRSLDYSPLDDWHNSPAYYSLRQNALRINVNVFIIDSDYNLQIRHNLSDDDLKIIQEIKYSNIDLSMLKNVLTKIDGRVLYISAFQTRVNSILDNGFLIIYADVTGLISFATSINIFLVILVFVMFIISVIATFFLSKSITHPIKKISMFASNIGHGKFSQNNFSFKEEEFDNLNIALNNTAKQLSIYDSEQKIFFQNVSHELRTPLMSIQCQAEGISYGLIEPSRAIETILNETHRLSNLVTDLLYISKIDNITTVYETAKINLLEIIRSCIHRQQLAAEKMGIKLLLNSNLSIIEYECVGELISRAFDNLISNAIRYAKTEIILLCSKNQDNIMICVTDDGCGIEPERIQHVFERFYKGNNGNHGIGLSIVKSIIEQHKGNITVKNNINSGAEFTILLPLNKVR